MGRFFWGRRTGPPWNTTGTRANQEGGASPAPTKTRKKKERRPEGRRYGELEDGAWFGYVGVEFVDYFGVLLLDYAALEFHGEGEAAAVEGEIVGEECEALDGFVLGEMGGEAGDFFFDEGVCGRMGGEFGVGGKFQAVFGELGGNGDGVGN